MISFKIIQFNFIQKQDIFVTVALFNKILLHYYPFLAYSEKWKLEC